MQTSNLIIQIFHFINSGGLYQHPHIPIPFLFIIFASMPHSLTHPPPPWRGDSSQSQSLADPDDPYSVASLVGEYEHAHLILHVVFLCTFHTSTYTYKYV